MLVNMGPSIIFGIFVANLVIFIIPAAWAEDCSALLGHAGRKRDLLFGGMSHMFNNLPNEVKAILPGHREVDSRCRFDLESLSTSQTQTLQSLYKQNYSICIGCSQTSSDHGRCHAIEVCRKGSSCIRGHNSFMVPTYSWHGCCEDTDPKCKSGSSTLSLSSGHGHHSYPLTYVKTVCKGPLCNEESSHYASQKNSVIAQLVGSSHTTKATPTSTTTTIQTGPINGGFTSWSTWGACDKSCDIGVRTRTRTCTNPVPANGGSVCVGQTTMTELCNVNPCSK